MTRTTRKEALKHVPNSVEGVVLGTRKFQGTTDLSQACELAQVHNRILRIPAWRGTYLFEKANLDLIDIEEAFNSDSWVVHFCCDYSAYHVIQSPKENTRLTCISDERALSNCQ